MSKFTIPSQSHRKHLFELMSAPYLERVKKLGLNISHDKMRWWEKDFEKRYISEYCKTTDDYFKYHYIEATRDLYHQSSVLLNRISKKQYDFVGRPMKLPKVKKEDPYRGLSTNFVTFDDIPDNRAYLVSYDWFMARPMFPIVIHDII